MFAGKDPSRHPVILSEAKDLCTVFVARSVTQRIERCDDLDVRPETPSLVFLRVLCGISQRPLRFKILIHPAL